MPSQYGMGVDWQLKSLPLAALAVCLLLDACASIPIIETPAANGGVAIQPVSIRGAHGPLSRRQTGKIINRLNAQVPNPSTFDRHLAIEQFVAGTPLYTGNRVTILRDGPQTFAAMFKAIRDAQHYLYLEFYILEDVSYGGEDLSHLLIERSHQGVQIDVIYDAIGSHSTPAEFFQRLVAAGIHVRQFHPITDLFSLNDRDHRKILISDSCSAIIGGINLSTDYESPTGSGSARRDGGSESVGQPITNVPAIPWYDTDLQIDGPAVMQVKILFERHWREEGGSADELTAYPNRPGPQGDQVVRIIGSQGGQTLPRYYATLLSAIRGTSSRVWVEAAYFVPTLQERHALARAAQRGVDVRLLLPSHSDSTAALSAGRSYYGGLLRAGVKIYERAQGMLHSKTAVMDGVWSIVGSSNLDHRSVLFNDEVDAVVIGDTTGKQMEQNFLSDLQHAQRIMLASWRRRPFSHKLREEFWRLWQQLL
jgi:cardiolipin synthase